MSGVTRQSFMCQSLLCLFCSLEIGPNFAKTQPKIEGFGHFGPISVTLNSKSKMIERIRGL